MPLVVFANDTQASQLDTGLSWRNPVPAGGDLTAVIHDGTQFVAAGTGSRIVHSVDGLNWSDPVFLTEDQMNALAFDGSTHVAVGGGGAIYTSSDLANWSLAGRTPNYTWLFGATFGDGRFVAVGDGGTAMVSTDGGATWAVQSTGTGQTLWAVVSGAGRYVAVGGSGSVVSSADGVIWSAATLPSGYETADYNDVQFLDGQFVAVGGNGAVISSTDGLLWTGEADLNDAWVVGLAFDGTNYLAASGDNRTLVSTDLITWTEQSTGDGAPLTAIRSIASGNGVTVVVGAGGMIRRTADVGINWTDEGSVGTTYGIFDVEWIEDQFYAVGSSGTLMQSSDGISWQLAPSFSGHWFNAVTRGAGVDVIATGFGFILVDDGNGWQEIDVGDNTNNHDLIYVDGTFHVVGNNGTYRFSSDAFNWTTSQIPGVSQDLESIAVKDGVMVTVGPQGLILRSDDAGANWSDESPGTSEDLHQVRVLDGLFVAVGNNRTVLLSTDGSNWITSQVPNNFEDFGYAFSDVSKGPDAYYVSSSSGRVARTTDWAEWTQFAAIDLKPNLTSVAFGAGRVVAGGDGGALLSTDQSLPADTLTFPSGGLSDQTAFLDGGSITLSVFASGPGDLTYAWERDGNPVPDATTPFLQFPGITADFAGTYTVTVTSSAGPTITSSTELSIAGLPAGDGPIYGTGHLPGGVDSSDARDATRVGDVFHAVGSGTIGGGYGFAADTTAGTYWRSDEGLSAVPTLEPDATLFFVAANAITPDARYIAARSRVGFQGGRVPIRVDADDGTIYQVPLGQDFVTGFGSAISDDGNIISGTQGFFDNSEIRWRGFVHDVTADTLSIVNPVLPDSEHLYLFGARGMSPDGSVVVGYEEDIDAANNGQRAIRYDSTNGTVLIPLISGGTWSTGYATSTDGVIALVGGDSAEFGKGEMFLHNNNDDSLVGIGSPWPEGSPNSLWGMSGDASVVVGNFVNDDFTVSKSYIYNQNGWFELDRVVAALGVRLDGWLLSGASGVSRDGRVVYGFGERNGLKEGFVIEFPEGYLANYTQIVEEPEALYWRNPFPRGGDFTSVIYDGTQFVAVGTGSRVETSPDGVNWSDPVFFPEEIMNGIAFDGTTYVAVGGGGGIYTSPDLSNWTFAARTTNFRWLFDIVFAGGQFVAVGDGGVAMTSPDGATWTEQSTGTSQTLRRIATDGTTFVAVGSSTGIVLSSADGASWSQVTLPSGYEAATYNAVEFLNGEFIALGENGVILHSTDAVTWTGSLDLNGQWTFGLVYDGSNYIAMSGDDRVFVSSDLTTWTDYPTGDGSPIGRVTGIATDGANTVVVGAGGMIRRSVDAGQTWSDEGSIGSNYRMLDVEWLDYEFMAVGSDGTLMQSSDGVLWDLLDVGSGHWFNAMARKGSTDVIATGFGYMIANDGGPWQEIDVGDNFENRDLILADGTFHAVGASGTWRYSSDGFDWTSTQISGVSQTLQSIAFQDGVMVIVGQQGLILRSDDGGANWTQPTSGTGEDLNRVRALDGLFVAVGNNRTVLLSEDGINWQTAPVPNDYVNFGWGYADVRKGPDAYYVVSTQGRVLRTTDWSNWTQFAGLETKPDFFALAFGPGRMVVAGAGGAILSTGEFDAGTDLQFPSGGLEEETLFANRGSVTLSVFATGPGDLTYAWDRDGVPIDGADSSFLSLVDLSGTDAGTYTVTVTSSDGPTLTSSTFLGPVGLPTGDGPIYGVGDLPGGGDGSQIRAATLVNDVIHAVGGSGGQPGGQFFDTGILWRSDEGLTVLPNLVPVSTGTSFVTASAITPDARFIAARSRNATNNNGRQATRIDTTDFSVDALPFTDGLDFYSAATTISDDGSVLYAFAINPATNGFETVRHEPDIASTTLLEIPQGNFDQMFPGAGLATTADGSVLVGSVANTADDSVNQAFLYEHGVGVLLIPLPAGGSWSSGQGISSDGQTVLLTGNTTEFPNGEVYLLDTTDDSIEPLGSPRSDWFPDNFIGMSGDASVIVAIFENDDFSESDTFVRNQHGWFALSEIVTSLGVSLDGWDLNGGWGVSADGRLVFGAGERNGVTEGFVIEFPEGYLAGYSPAGALVFGIGDFSGPVFLDSEVRDATLVDGNIHATGFAQDVSDPSRPPRQTPVYWSLGGGLQRLPHFDDSTFSTATFASTISPDGTYIAGRTWANGSSLRQSARWDTRDLSVELVPTPSDILSSGYSAATTISDDGNKVASFYVPEPGVLGAFIADINTGAVTTLVPDVPEVTRLFPAGPRGFSSDGSVLVGNYQIVGDTTDDFGYRYTAGGGFTTLPLLDGGSWNRATSLTSDGQITLLTGDSTAFPEGELYLHDASDGSLTPLGSPESDAAADAFLVGMTSSADVMVARFTRPDDSRVSYIRNEHGWFALNELVEAAGGSLGNWDLSNATGISRDGRLVFGSGEDDGSTAGFVVQFEEDFLADYMLVELAGPVDPEIVGAWRLDEDTSTAILVFTPEGEYAHMQDVNSAQENEQTGYELGQFEFNLDGSFRLFTEDDTNGEIGLSGISGRSDVTAAIVGDQLTVTIPGDGAFALTRIADETNQIVGGWQLDAEPGADADELVLVVLDSDGRYFLLHDGPSEPGAQSGIEWGSYAWNSETNAFAVSDITIDQNGEYGLNDPEGSAFVDIQNLGFRLVYSDDEDPTSFRRIAFLPVDISAQPEGDELDTGEDLNLSVEAAGEGPFTYQWRKDGVNIDGATASTYMVMGVSPEDAGTYDVIITGPDGSVLSAPAIVAVEDAGPSDAYLSNFSVRHTVPTGSVFALPFRIEGTASKQLLLRAVGPTLGGFGLPGTMDDPRIRLVDELGFEVAVNDDWEDSDGSTIDTLSAQRGAFGLGSGSEDAAIVVLLPAGSYTMLIDSVGGGGVVLAEVYDADSTGSQPDTRLVYLAALGDTSVDSFTAGFVNSGTDPAELVLRAVGPGTGLVGASGNPSLGVFSGQTEVLSNDDWDSSSGLPLDFEDVGAPALQPGSTDAAAIIDLPPGAHTLQVGGSPGRVLAEIYDFYDRDLPITPILLLPPRSVTVTEGEMTRFETIVTGADSVQWLKDGNPVSEGNSPILDFMSVTESDAGDYVLRLTNGQGNFDTAPVTLTVLAGSTPPSISSQPISSTIQSGETATLNVTVVSTTGNLSYQWYEGTSGDTSVPLSGATLPSYTTPALSTTTSYWVRATDDAGGVDSDTATVTVAAPSSIFATHSVVGSGYVAGGSVTVTTTLTYTGSADSFGWNVSLPAGWSYQAIAMPPVPQVTPTSGNTGVIGFAFTSPPASPVTFTYVLNVPAEQTGAVNLTAEVLFRDGQAETPAEQVFVVTPDPLVIGPVPPFHSADTDGDSAIDLSELLRVIQLYNTRNGTARTGHYKVQAGTEDGFAPDSTLTNSQSGGLSRFHSADTSGEGDNPDGKIDLSELLRVIQIYNYRSGTTRTGEYRIQAGTEDGFAPGPEPVF